MQKNDYHIKYSPSILVMLLGGLLPVVLRQHLQIQSMQRAPVMGQPFSLSKVLTVGFSAYN